MLLLMICCISFTWVIYMGEKFVVQSLSWFLYTGLIFASLSLILDFSYCLRLNAWSIGAT